RVAAATDLGGPGLSRRSVIQNGTKQLSICFNVSIGSGCCPRWPGRRPPGVVSKSHALRHGFFEFQEFRVAARFFSCLFLAGAAGWSAQALSGVCDARFMHDGGAVQLTGSGNLSLGADLSFAEVVKTNSANCRARVQGTASFSYAGLPAGKSKLDYLMTIKNGKAEFVRYAKAGEKPD